MYVFDLAVLTLFICIHPLIVYWVPNESKLFCVGCSIITPSDILYPTSLGSLGLSSMLFESGDANNFDATP